MSRAAFVGATMTLVVLWSARARADESTHDKAVALFQEGRKYIEQSNCDAAITKLRESLALEPSIGARLSLADCYESRDGVEAWWLFKEAAAQAFVNRDDRIGVAEQRAAAIEKRVATIRVIVPPPTLDLPGLELRLDGAPVDRYMYKGQTLAAKPGRHVVEAFAPGRHWSQEVVADMNPGVATVRLQPDNCATGAVPPATAAARAPQEERGSTRRLLGAVVGGVGLAGIVNGAIFGAITLTKKSDINSLCGGNTGACQAPNGSLDVEREAAKTTAAVSTASFIAGGILFVGGGVLFFTAPSGTTGSVGVAPSVAQNGGGLTVRGLW